VALTAHFLYFLIARGSFFYI